jgi:hypothetical protein
VNLRSDDGVERVFVQAGSNNFFDLLGVNSAMGQFSPQESRPALLMRTYST